MGSGFIVPGGILGTMGISLPFSWYAIVKHKTTGKQWTYWFNGNNPTRETVAAYIATRYRNVEVITIDRCKEMPTRPLQKIPSDHYDFGIIRRINEEVAQSNGVIRREPVARQSVIGKSILRG